MNYGEIKKCDIANGEGVRVALFVSGCRHHCKGCFNSMTWDFNYGKKFTEETEEEILEALKPNYIDGLSLLGGEPFEPENQEVLVKLLRKVKERYPEKNIWCYSGYLFDEELKKESRARCEYTDEMLSMLDVLVDGRFEEDKKNTQPIRIRKLTPIQMPHVDMDEVKNGRKAFTKEEWMDILLRSTGMEPDKLYDRVKWLLIARMIPLVHNSYNMCELGPRSTGKSYIYEQISPNSILVAGGQTTVANLFYNMSNNTVGLVGMWDVVAFDEVAGIKFKDKDGIQIMKGYMASGAFSRGKAEIQAKASMVFVGNINQSVETLQKTSSLFDPFPPEMGTDTAFLDRFHAYIPGWEIPKYRPDSFTNDYGFITDYLSEFMRELRKDNYSNIAEKYFKLGNNLNQRDAIAVRKLISGFIKLIYPDGEVNKEEVAEIMDISLELRRRVKEQLKKIGGMEFYDVNFSYIDNDSFDEHFVSVPEQGGGKMISEGIANPG